MEVIANKYYILGDYRMEPAARLLYRGGQRIRLANRPFNVLQYLIEHRERLVGREELLDRFWDGRDVYDDALRKSVGAIRKALDDSVSEPRFVETRWAGGYRYIGPVEERIGRAELGVAEMERTRGFRIVIEEEIQDAAVLYAEPEPIQVPATIAPVKAARRYTRTTNAVLALTMLAFMLMSAFIAYRTHGQHVVTADNLAGATKIDSIAVMPLKNLSDDPSQEYFSDGLTDSFITELSHIKGLRVLSRSSAFTFKGKEVDPRDVGQKLGVAAILEGSVRKRAEMVRVEVRLVSTEDGRVLWSGDSHDQALKDIFATQDEIACNIATKLRVKLCGKEDQLKRYTNNVDAYQAYLKGRYFINNQYTDINTVGPEKMLRKAADYFDQAIKIDPNYAPAYAGLADANTGIVWFSAKDPKPLIDAGESAALKAVQLDETLAEGHTALATVYVHEWDFDAAAKEYEGALALNPGSAAAHDGYATYLMAVGRTDEMLAEMKQAEAFDPLNVYIMGDRGSSLYMARRYDEAIAEFRKGGDLLPSYVTDMNMGQCYLGKGLYKEAIEQFQKADQANLIGGRRPDTITNLAVGYAMAGKKQDAKPLLDEMMALSKRQYVPKCFFAAIYAALGDKDGAFEMLGKAYSEHDSNLIGLKLHPWFDPLRSDPRFTTLTHRLGVSS